ncbi:hypothetical protein ACFY8B_33205 [Streptomyces sp. NPDC012751]|uniref:hypothetical protein n=1 Tax=Streptomyces sp. NPDC012751 TaxID=3364846 RepID=UPI0036741889
MPVLPRYHYLPIGLVRAVMFVVGGCTAPHLTSQQLVLDSLGGDEDPLSRASAVLQAAPRLATLVGPDVAGVLVSMMRASGVLFLDSASFVLSAVIVWRRLPTDAAAGAARRSARAVHRPSARGLVTGTCAGPSTTTHRPWPAYCSPPSVAVRSWTPSRSTPRSGSLRLLDTVADTPALATFTGEVTRLVRPAGFGLRRIPVTAPTPVYPHSLLWHRDNPHPALTTLRAHLTTTATGRDTTGTWTPDWASPR